MTEQRMDLKAAGRLLHLSPNGVRARAASGQIRHEKDNKGKWWVFLDPETVANQTSKLELPEASSEGSNVTSKPLDFEPERRALEAHIGTLEAALAAARSEIDTLRGTAGAVPRLEASLEALRARFDDKAGEVESLRAMLAAASEERQKLVADFLEKIAAKAENPAVDKRGWLARLFTARKS